jgi:hypothetical protein
MLRDGEAERLRALGLDVFEHDGRQNFSLPCPRLAADKTCQIYPDRPHACAGYRCGMLDDYLGGTIALDEAETRIAEVERLLGKVREFTDPAMTIAKVRQQWRGGLADFMTGNPASAALEQQAFLHMTALCRYLDRHILSPFEPSIMQEVDRPLEPTPDPS